MLSEERDEHLEIGEGEYDFGFLMGCVEYSPFRLVTVETPRTNSKSLDEDTKNLIAINPYDIPQVNTLSKSF